MERNLKHLVKQFSSTRMKIFVWLMITFISIAFAVWIIEGFLNIF